MGLLRRVLENWYDERTKPAGFTAKGLMQEILMSYKLLVLFDRDARRVYRDTLRPGVQGPLFDPELDALCLAQLRRFYHEYYRYFGGRSLRVRETFYVPSDFAGLSPRLAHLERFIDSIQPSRFSSLWKDKRDILRWYTFAAVMLLGGINLIVALAQVGLGAGQVYLSRLALQSGG